jgi:hypothetical protein
VCPPGDAGQGASGRRSSPASSSRQRSQMAWAGREGKSRRGEGCHLSWMTTYRNRRRRCSDACEHALAGLWGAGPTGNRTRLEPFRARQYRCPHSGGMFRSPAPGPGLGSGGSGKRSPDGCRALSEESYRGNQDRRGSECGTPWPCILGTVPGLNRQSPGRGRHGSVGTSTLVRSAAPANQSTGGRRRSTVGRSIRRSSPLRCPDGAGWPSCERRNAPPLGWHPA